MSEKKRERILFSCLGSTDPVRGEHDGAMLHIARHYRPDKIQWYITPEMRRIDEKDHRFMLAMEYLGRQCPGYSPEILPPVYGRREDVADFDGFYDDFRQLFTRLSRSYPEAEILVNLSSGTPQMKTTLVLLCSDLVYRTRAIQVKNFESRSGTALRTTAENYELELELELNQDAQPGAPNRCSEPKLILVQRKKLTDQVESLLKRYDYGALEDMGKLLPEELRPLVKHMACRSAYDMEGALSLAGSWEGMELYPAKEKKLKTYGEYRALSEYILVLKAMQRTGRLTDLVIRLNPLVIRLQRAFLESGGLDMEGLMKKAGGRERIRRELLENSRPELLAWLDEKYADRGGFADCDPSIQLYNYIIDWLGKGESGQGKLYRSLEKLNRERNGSAHSLNNLGEREIKAALGCSSQELVRGLVSAMEELFPRHFSPELFNIYDSVNRYIRSKL